MLIRKFCFFIIAAVLSGLYSCNVTDDGDDESGEVTIEGIEEDSDYHLSGSDSTVIELNGTSVSVNGEGVSVSGSEVTIENQGTYYISGTLSNGQIKVKTDDEGVVQLVLKGVEITNTSTSPLFVDKAVKVVLMLSEGSNNTFTDGASYSDTDEGQNAAIYSQSYLSIFGEGNLTVTGKYKDGITGKDGFVIKSGNINVTAADDGIRGKDYLHIYQGNITVVSGGDGIISDNEDSESTGIILIENGTFNITAGGDGINAASALSIQSGTFDVTSGGGSSKTVSSAYSAKALKASTTISLTGDFILSAAEDAIHSNGDITINSGSYIISAADDGIHATNNIVINSGDISITKSEEGIEGKFITYNSGNISIVANDDANNSTAGHRTEANDGSYTYINGGTLILNSATGDPLDSNGSISMTGGTVIIHGPKSQPEVPIDYNGTFNLDNGILIASGPSSNMTQVPGSSSKQNTLGIMFRSSKSTSTLFNIQDESGNSLVTFQPARSYSVMIFSSADLVKEKTYTIYSGGTSTGINNSGLYTGGTYSGGTAVKTFTISNTITTFSGL